MENDRRETLQQKVAQLTFVETKARLAEVAGSVPELRGYELLYALGEIAELTGHLDQMVGLSLLGIGED